MEALWCHLDNQHMATMTTENKHGDTGYSCDSADGIQYQTLNTREEPQYSCVTQHPRFDRCYLDINILNMLKEEVMKLEMSTAEKNMLPTHRLVHENVY